MFAFISGIMVAVVASQLGASCDVCCYIAACVTVGVWGGC